MSELTHRFDVVIVGSGLAGLSLALSLPKNLKIAVLAKDKLTEASTYYAQGGVAAVLDKTDSSALHIQDTLEAGAGLCELSAVTQCVEGGSAAVDFLLEHGVEFTRENGELHLTREGGHSARRIIHHVDATGVSISTRLTRVLKEQAHIEIFERYCAIDVVTDAKLDQGKNDHLDKPSRADRSDQVRGLYALNLATDEVVTFSANFVALACGGASKSYLYTSNPDIATGDGVAMAYRAGARVANMEFNQFHPTCLFHTQARSFLLTEALRGEGAHLKLPDGTRFMPNFDARAELAPRDIVARAIDFEIKRLGVRHVWLDISHKDPEFVREHFPMLNARLSELGIDMTREPIPVVPAAHYTCGGVLVDRHSQTDIRGLFAIGETSYTGLHGANRLASNSLLECVVFGKAAAAFIADQLGRATPAREIPDWDASQVTDPDEEVVILQNWDELRHTMWNYVGIVRSDKRLARALSRIQLLSSEIDEYYQGYRVSKNLIELRNLVCVAEMIVRCALARKESRGLHYSLDYPDLLETPCATVLSPEDAQVSLQPT